MNARNGIFLGGLLLLAQLGGCDDDAKPVADSGPDSDSDSDTDVDADTDVDTDTDTDADAGPDAGQDAGPDAATWLPGEILYESECGGAEDTPGCLFFVDGDALVDGGVSGDGLSWATALGTVQDGIDAAYAALDADMDAGVARCHVWVAEGTYYPTADASGDTAPTDPQTMTISLRGGVNLYGGFAGDETACDQRDVAAHGTNLSGDIGVVGDEEDNAYAIVTGADDAVLDGFTLRDGGITAWDPCLTGYGMINNGVSPVIANCAFRDIASGCDAGDDGAAMYNLNGAAPQAYACTFSDNSIAVENLGDTTRPLFYDCLFEQNTSWGCPGDVCAGCSAMLNHQATPFVVNSRFFENSGDSHGAVCFFEGSAVFIGCLFANNSAFSYGGGAIAVSDASVRILDSVFFDNTFHYGGPDEFGGAISLSGTAELIVVNSILAGDQQQIGLEDVDTDAGTSTCFAYGTDILPTGSFPCLGEGNLEVDPSFVSTDIGAVDLHLLPSSPCIDAGRSDLLPNDFLDLDGDDDRDEPWPFDLDGDPREVGCVDMGAYEAQ